MKRYVQREFRFDASESETLCMDGSSLSGNREISEAPPSNHMLEGRLAKVNDQTADMYAAEKSDDLVVPSKRANNFGFGHQSSHLVKTTVGVSGSAKFS